jgi:hypothetical protein
MSTFFTALTSADFAQPVSSAAPLSNFLTVHFKKDQHQMQIIEYKRIF